MKQALHIFRKDLDALRIEIGVFDLLAFAFAWTKIHIRNDDWTDPLLLLAASFLIARVVHADGIPGDRQFWLTRPYNRMSLLSAQLLFIVVCVSLPVACAQLAVAVQFGYPMRQVLAGLFFNQLALLGIGALPVLALSSLTRSIVAFIPIALALALVSQGGSSTLTFWFPDSRGPVPDSVAWIRNVLAELLLLVMAAVVIFRQYRHRTTGSSIVVAIIALNIVAAVYLLVPASAVLRAQSWFSTNSALSSGVTVSVKPADDDARLSGSMMHVPLALVVDHPAPNVEIRADDLNISASWPGRPLRFAQRPGVNRRSEDARQSVFDVGLLVSPTLYQARLDEPMTITGSLFLTMFGEEERRRISLRNGRATAQDGLRCEASGLTDRARAVIPPPGAEVTEWHSADSLICAALFRWPSKLVYAQAGDAQADFSNTLISYSPLPARFSLAPMDVRWSEPLDSEEVTIVTRKPLLHFRRDFALAGIRLRDFERWRMMLPAWPPPHK
jgi:hypothetical protein